MVWTRATVLKVAKRTGYPVVEAWSGHNAGQMGTVYGPMLHHTGSPGATGDFPTLRVVRDGRAGLLNSLCMYGLGRSGTIYCINEKISWHAGTGNWNGVTDGNGHFAGIEAESAGNGLDWTPQQIDAYKRLCASILMETGRGTEWMPAHKEYALPRGRKPDPAGIDMATFRRDVQKYLDNPSLLNGGIEDDMEVWDLVNFRPANNQNLWDALLQIQINQSDQARQIEDLVNKAVQPSVEKAVNVDVGGVAAALATNKTFIEELAKAVNDESDRRDRDGDPRTGQTS